MGKGKKMAGGSFMSKHAQNLLNYMPIDDKASALQYKGKKMEESPLHDWGILQSDMKKSGRKFADIARGGPSATARVRNVTKKVINKLHTKMSSDPKSKNYLSQEERSLVRSKKRRA